ncbi:MAG: hypothetical protein ACE5HE_01510 [Phycisphaerae bacterium]
MWVRGRVPSASLGYLPPADSRWEFLVIDTVKGPYEALPAATHRRPAPHPVYWVTAGALIVIATAMIVRPGGGTGPVLTTPAMAQAATSGGARGIFAFSGQLSKNTYGVYMVDVDAMTMWVYEYLPQKGCLRLAAARTWRYDRYLENHNLCDLPPDAVEQMIEEQRRYRLQSSESRMP